MHTSAADVFSGCCLFLGGCWQPHSAPIYLSAAMWTHRVTNSPGWDGRGEGGGGGRTFLGGSLRGEELATRHVPHSNAGSRFWAWTWPQECGSWERGRRAAASIDGAQVGVSSDYHKTARGCGSDPSFTAGTGGVSRAPHSLPGVGLSLSATHACCKVWHVLGCRKIKGLQYLLREMLFGFIVPPLRRDAKLGEYWEPVVMKYSWKLLKDAFVLFASYTDYWLFFFFGVCLCCCRCEPAHLVRACVCKILIPVLKC